MTVHQCSLSETKFADGEQMRNHIIQTHSGKLWPCEQEGCYRYFTTKKGWNYHLGEVHIQKNFSCSPCNEEFSNVEDLSNHKKMPAHKMRSKQSVCKDCKKVFTGKYESTRHFNTACPFNPDRAAKCKVCNVNTGKAREFLAHLKEAHNSKNQYLCTRCLLDFATENIFLNIFHKFLLLNFRHTFFVNFQLYVTISQLTSKISTKALTISPLLVFFRLSSHVIMSKCLWRLLLRIKPSEIITSFAKFSMA